VDQVSELTTLTLTHLTLTPNVDLDGDGDGDPTVDVDAGRSTWPDLPGAPANDGSAAQIGRDLWVKNVNGGVYVAVAVEVNGLGQRQKRQRQRCSAGWLEL